MKIKLHTITTYLLIFLLSSFFSCSQVKDEQPVPTEQIPGAVARILTASYPDAKDITLKTIEKDKAWEARFSQDQIQYYVALNPSKILATHRLISQTVPDSIRKYLEVIPLLSPNKGVFSDLREIIDTTGSNRYYSAKFVVDQKEHLLVFSTWASQPSNEFVVTLTSYYKFRYDDYIDEIDSYLTNNNYSRVYADVRVLGDNKKRYLARTGNVNGDDGDVVFDDAKQLIVSIKKVGTLNQLSDFPEKIQTFIKNTGLSLTDQNYKFAENNVSGYHVFLVGVIGLNGYRYSLDFDLDGNVIASDLNLVIAHNRK